MENNKNNHCLSIESIMSDSFGKYAKYIIQERALPDVRDGLKPVQRRILFAMNQLQLFHDRPHKKSARTVGEVIGKYHPHGDSSIYEAMVRLSQEWKNNICPLDMHGNKGSIDGDSPAAMRYTECRLSHYGQSLIYDIKKNCVPFISNFDGSEIEPTVLPSLFPNLLINGATGIAAGYATNIPPFNPNELVNALIAKIDTPNCTLDRLLKIMPSPDFSTGGNIANLSGVTDAYKTGKGKIVIRATIVEGKKQLLITDIPYETNKSEIIRSIDALKEKIEALGILEVRDESDGNGINIALDLKSGANIDFIKNCLYKNTRLQISYNMNMVVIANKKPILMPMLDILQSFIDHADNIIFQTSKYDLDKALLRQEILKGIIKAISIIDDVVAIIRRSSDKANAVERLQSMFGFTKNQADAIVNLRLYKLSNTDAESLQKELIELEKKIIELKDLVENKLARNMVIKEKLREFKKNFGFERKSLITNDDFKIVIDEMEFVEDKEYVFTFTKNGYMKKMTKKNFIANELKENKISDDDLILNQFVANNRDKTLLVSSDSKVYSIPNHKIDLCKFKEQGMHLNDVLELGEGNKIVSIISCPSSTIIDKRHIIIATRSGHIKRVEIDELLSKKTVRCVACGKLEANDAVISAIALSDPEATKLMVITANSFANIYATNQIPLTGKNAQGVKAIKFKDDDALAYVMEVDSDLSQIIIATNLGLKRINVDEVSQGSRSNQGRQISSFIASAKDVYVMKILPYSPKLEIYCLFEKTSQYLDSKQVNYLNGQSKIYNTDGTLLDCQIFAPSFLQQKKAEDE